MELAMIAEAEIETPQQTALDDEFESTLPRDTPCRGRLNVFLIGIVALVLVAISTGWYLYSRGYESTDDAQVDGHLNPIAARIDGTIKAVHVEDNQAVHAGTLLVELDSNDDNVALKQAQAQYDEALAQLAPRIPTFPSRALATLTMSPRNEPRSSVQKRHSPPRSMIWTPPSLG